MDEIALAHAGREERTRHAERIGPARHRLEDWARRREHVRVVPDCAGRQTSEGRRLALQRHQLGLPDHGQRGQRGPVRHRVGVDTLEQARDGRRAHRGSQMVAQRREQVRLARLGVTRFEGVVVVGGHAE